MRALTVLIILSSTIVAKADVIYVSSDFGHEVLRYDADTGAYIDTFITAGSGGLNQPHAILERCNDLLVCSFGTDSVLRFDRETGAFIDVFIDSSNGLSDPVYLQYGQDGNLYLSSQASDEILRYTAAGEFVDVFVTAGAGGLDGPSGFAFGPDGRLYVAGRYSANVIAYDGSTGAFDEVIADASDGLGVGDTFGLNFGDNGDLYFASNGQVFRYDLDTASVLATIPLGAPIGIEPGPPGSVLVATANNLRAIDTSDDSVSGPLLTGGTISTLNFFRIPGTPPAPGCTPSNVPALPTWGLVLLGLAVLTMGTLVYGRPAGAGVPSRTHQEGIPSRGRRATPNRSDRPLASDTGSR